MTKDVSKKEKCIVFLTHNKTSNEFMSIYQKQGI